MCHILLCEDMTKGCYTAVVSAPVLANANGAIKPISTLTRPSKRQRRCFSSRLSPRPSSSTAGTIPPSYTPFFPIQKAYPRPLALPVRFHVPSCPHLLHFRFPSSNTATNPLSRTVAQPNPHQHLHTPLPLSPDNPPTPTGACRSFAPTAPRVWGFRRRPRRTTSERVGGDARAAHELKACCPRGSSRRALRRPPRNSW